MFVMPPWDLNTVTTLKLGCCSLAKCQSISSCSTVLGMQFKLGLEISGLVGHVYPCVHFCVCVCLERVRQKETETCEGEIKLQTQHTLIQSAHVFSASLRLCSWRGALFVQMCFPMHNTVTLNRIHSTLSGFDSTSAQLQLQCSPFC